MIGVCQGMYERLVESWRGKGDDHEESRGGMIASARSRLVYKGPWHSSHEIRARAPQLAYGLKRS